MSDEPTGLDRLRQVVERLRAPDGCPWDRRQSLESMVHYLLEETYEVVDVMTADADAHREELGDLLFQIVFHAQLRAEEGAFTLDEVVDGIADKLIRRHPHVFGDEDGSDPERVALRWEQLKREEGRGPLDGIPRALPALMRAEKVGKRAARVGFDWPDVDGPIDKLREEVDELAEAAKSGDRDQALHELGDVLFSAVNVARHLKVHPEDALTGTTERFMARFAWVLARLEAESPGTTPEEAGLERLDRLWDEAKLALEGGRGHESGDDVPDA